MASKHFPISETMLVEYFNQLTDHLFIAKPCEDGDFELISGNATMLKFFGMEPEQVVGKTLRQILGKGAAAERIIATYQQVLESGRSLVYEEDSGGTDFDYEVFETSLFRFEDPESGEYRVGGISRNISLRKSIEESLELSKRKLESKVRELEVVHKQLQQESMRDPLTSLLNRSHLDEFLHHEIARAQRQQMSLSIMMVDLDNFKQLNDTYGHQVGDQVLRDFGHFIRSNRRRSDIIFRFGGDEFLFILPGLDIKQAGQFANQLRHDLNQQVFDVDTETTQLHMSMGIASYPEHGKDAYALIEQADSALYLAKKRGKDSTASASKNSD